MDFGAVAAKVISMSDAVQTVMGVEVGDVVVAEPEVRPRTRTSRGDAGNEWLCAWCLNRVASEKDRFAYESESQFAFKNPNGILFQIITFTQTIGCQESGVPTLEHTWFAGHAWSYCACDRCRAHLGWYYSGPSDFVGLIRERIVRRATALN